MHSSQSVQPAQPTCLVTGAAGFIGSHLSEALVARGYAVIGVDAFVDFYPRAMKETNLAALRQEPLFTFIEADLRTADLTQLLAGVDYVFHLAAQAGVRTSWGEGFTSYVEHNVLVTQRLLEAAKESNVRRVIYASSSSVYGHGSTQPAHETNTLLPISPYGVTKLAGEYLCRLYTKEFDLPTISLRYFTVYGPRQRPDMAFHKFIRAILQGEQVTIYGNGEQSRDFTYVSDIVAANIAAMRYGLPGNCYNIGGGVRVTVNEVLHMLEQITEKRAYVHYIARQHGDAAHTASNTDAARAELGYNPRFNLADGLSREVRWVAEQLEPVVQLV
ncbi:MAG TPA: NAD-dependent epimerase/dehydratase family protein [Ktedonobacteraceae bacterium]|nr:NAD-dependent epimerase/dehydratase family protein [Ktedonobacteraceae bacterium]